MYDLIPAILTSLGGGVAAAAWELLLRRAREKGLKGLPSDATSEQHRKTLITAVQEQAKNLQPDEARSIIADLLAAAGQKIVAIRDERLRQGRTAFNVVIGLIVTGVLFAFGGVGLLLLGKTTAGAVTAGAGVISNITSVILMRVYREVNRGLDEAQRELKVIEKAQIGLGMLEKMGDGEKRDDAIRDLVKALTRIS